MPSVSWSDINTEHVFDSSAAPMQAAPQSLTQEAPTPRPPTRRATRGQSPATPFSLPKLDIPNESLPQGNSPCASSTSTFLGLQIHDKVSHGSPKLASFPLSMDPTKLFEPYILNTPAATPSLPRVILIYTPLQERLSVTASDGKAITVGDILRALYHWKKKPPRLTFAGVLLSDEDDGQLILQLSYDI